MAQNERGKDEKNKSNGPIFHNFSTALSGKETACTSDLADLSGATESSYVPLTLYMYSRECLRRPVNPSSFICEERSGVAFFFFFL